MRAPTCVALSLAVATAAAATAIASKLARAEPAITWIQFSTSGHQNTVQHITTARYSLRSQCEIDRKQIVDGLVKAGLIPIIEPICTSKKPWSWIDRP